MSNLTVDTRDLAHAVAWAAKTLPARPSVPTLAGILVHAEDGRVDLSGFDYDAHTRATVTADGGLTGTWLVSGKLAEAVTKTLDPKRPTVITADGTHVRLANGATRVSMPTMPVEDYPTLPTMPQPVGTVDAKTFADAVARVAPATGPHATPTFLCGVHLKADDSQLRLSASDRYRAAIGTVDWDGDNFETLVLADQIGKLASTLSHGADAVTVSHADNLFGLSTETRSAVLRRLAIEGENASYPDIGKMFPSLESTVVRLDTTPLKVAVERAALVLEPKAAIRLTSDGGALRILGTGLGEVDDEVAADVTGGPLDIRCNPAYLLTALSTVGAATVNLWFGAPHRPFSVTSADQDETYRHIVVPVRSLT